MKRMLCGWVALSLLLVGAEQAVADYLYWADFGTSGGQPNGDIERANLDGTGRSTLVTGLSNPFGIALDVAGGTMYWSAPNPPNPKIGRANLDGTGRSTLIPNVSSVQALALDVPDGKIYWIVLRQGGGPNPSQPPGHAIPGHIASANLDGPSSRRRSQLGLLWTNGAHGRRRAHSSGYFKHRGAADERGYPRAVRH